MSTSLKIDEENDDPATTSQGDRYSDMGADLKLISSDEHVFRIPSYAFQASSPVVRDMLAIERSTPSDLPKVINFSDPDIETGAVIRSFLDICLHQEYHVLDNKIASAVVDFAQKYEFNIELERIELYLLRRLLTNSQCGYKYQFLAVALGNWQLVGLCIVFLSNNPSIEDQAILDGRAAMRRAIDFRTHDLTSFQDIYRFGPKFTMAMVKASDQSRKTSSVDYQSMGKLFVEMMVANADK